MSASDRPLTSADLAWRWGVSVRWVERQVAEGRMPCSIVFRTGRRLTYRFTADDIARFEARWIRRLGPEVEADE